MYLYLGGNTVIKDRDIIGIFDLDNTTVSKKTRDFLNTAEKRKNTVYTSYDLPKTFIIANKKAKKSAFNVYITSVSVRALHRRLDMSEKQF